MVKLKIKYLSLILSILALIAFVQTISIAGPAIAASINQTLKASSIALPSDRLGFVALSPDGNTLASVGSDEQIILWDIVSGQVRVTLPNQFKDLVSGIVFSPDSNTLASVSGNSIQLWDAISGDVRLTLPASALVTDPVFSPDGKTLAAVAQGANVTLWNAQSGSTTQILTNHQNGVNAITFSPDSKTLATGGQDAQIKLWNVATGVEQARLPGEGGIAVTDLVFSPDGKTLAVSGQDARIMLWNLQSDSTTQVLTNHQNGVNAITFSPDSKTLATGGQDAQIKLWNVATGVEQASLSGRGGAAVTDLVFSPDGKALASAGESEQVFLWDVSNKLKLPQLLTGHRDWVDKVVFSPNQKTLVSVGKTGQVVEWDLMTGMEQLFFQVPSLGATSVSPQGFVSGNLITNTVMPAAAGPVIPNGNSPTVNVTDVSQSAKNFNKKKSNHDWKGVTSLAISPDGMLYGGAAKDGIVRLWTSSGKERFAISEHHGAAVTGVVFSADGKFLVSVARDTEVQIRDVTNGKKVQTLLAHEHPIRTVAASPDGKFLASAGEETRIMLWEAQTGKLIRILSGHTDFVNAVSFSVDGKHLASAGADGRILLWDIQTGQLIQTLLDHSNEVNAVAFSKDGKFLASGSVDSQVILWNAATGQKIQSFAGHQASIRAVAFSPNGQKLVSTGEDTKILVWDITTRKLDKQIVGTTNAINALAFNPLGNLITGSEDGEVKEWDVNKGQTKQIISVTVQPQSNNSKTIPSVSIYPIESVVAGAGQFNQPIATEAAAVTPPNIFNRILNWLIPAAEAAIPAPPGGPILVATKSSNCPGCGVFNNYYAEILRTEGLNEFAVVDISLPNTPLTSTLLSSYDVVILPQMSLTATEVTTLSAWVEAGGNLIAMRPDPQLAGLLGLTSSGSTLSNGYLLVNTSQAPGNGIGVNGQPMQFHGIADSYTLNGASSVATLYSNFTTATANPAVTLRSVGINGGHAAAFTYDLATSIVYTRQGNPTWAAQERDGFTPIRSDDKFFGNAAGDPQPDWVDLLNEVAVPQADEQQRLLANLITQMNLAKKPLPRFWYFPHGEKAVVIMTGDDHGNGGTGPRFDQFNSLSPAGCSVANWECVRGTSYIYTEPTNLSDKQAAAYTAAGFEVGLHVNTNCADFNLTAGDPQNLETIYSQQIATFQAAYPSISALLTERHHCIVWSDWVTGAQVMLNHGIRLDTSYYFWPPSWVNDRPGHFTGSAMPMRFSDLSGNLIDVYNAVSHMTDESGQTYPFTINTLLDRAIGAEAYYGAYTINAHTDLPQESASTDTVYSALSRSVPIVSGAQMLTWLDGRNNSSFSSLNWNGSNLSFAVSPGSGANGLEAMLPAINSVRGALVGIIGPGGSSIQYKIDTIKGVQYAFFSAAAGTYTANYGSETAPPTVISTSPANGTTGVFQTPTVTATFSEAINSSTVTNANFQLQAGTNPPVSATVSYDSSTNTAKLIPNALLAGSTQYTATLLSGIKDLSGNSLAAPYTWTFTTQATPSCVSLPPCQTWSGTATPTSPSVSDSGSVELGVKFRSDLNGWITGIRFYKGTGNTGTHVGTLWTSGGVQLAQATFTNETATGWQQVTFAQPVAITANTTYVASYHAPQGHYAADNNYFTKSVDNVPIHLLADAISGGNGVFNYSAGSVFPNSTTYQATNYWVDVAFTATTQPLAVSTTTVPGGAVGVAYSTTLVANGGTLPYSWAITSGALPTGLTLDLVRGTISGTPTATGTSNFTVQVTDSAKATASQALSITVTAPATSIWPSTAVPGLADSGPDSAVELGVKFKSDVAGTITGLRFYKGSGNTGTHVGNLWSSTGTKLASATFSGETASGWQQVNFSTPVSINANTVYVASYHTNVGHYSDDQNYFATAGVDNAPLHALANGVSGGDGVFAYGSGSAFPSQTWNASNYWVDVAFTAAGLQPLAVSTTTMPGGAVGVAYSTTLAANGGTSPYTWAITSGALPVGLTLNPTSGIISGTPTATGIFNFAVQVTDSANPKATASQALSITITAPATSIWPSTAVPGLADSGPDSAVELGVKFKSDVAGTITGLRFYKGSGNTGTHVGNLWSSTGTKLASATFSGETASGWQQVNFSTPVSINANTVYVASYHTNVGHYSDDQNYFATAGVDNAPLHALANGVSGGDGVYAYGSGSAFPSQTWNASNYWVDVVFRTP